jgi:hypothetical protein
MNDHHPRIILGETGHGTGTLLAGLDEAAFLGRGVFIIDPLGELVSALAAPAPPAPPDPPPASGGEATCVRIRAGLLLSGIPEAPDDL